MKITKALATVDGADLERLRAVRLSDADIWDVGAVAAFFNLSNRMASLADSRPNREFYTRWAGEDQSGSESSAPERGRAAFATT